MTDKEIIKALDYCKDCYANINIDIIDLIDRQQAEIEELKNENRILSEKRANFFEILLAFARGEKKEEQTLSKSSLNAYARIEFLTTLLLLQRKSN